MPGKFALQLVQLPARQVHVAGRRRLIQLRELATQPGRVRRLNPGLAAFAEKGLQALVCKALNHDSECIA